jgi:hypothetical protein
VIHRHPRDYWRFTPDGIELLLSRFKIIDCTVEGSLEWPIGIWAVAQKTSSQDEWGKLPALNVVKMDALMLKRMEKSVKRWKNM